jgi:hypothetical protein
MLNTGTFLFLSFQTKGPRDDFCTILTLSILSIDDHTEKSIEG